MSHARAESKQSSSSPSLKKDSGERADTPSSASFSARRQGPLYTAGPAVGLDAGERSTQDVRGIQPKLTVSEPDDKHEREAERVADAVMRMPDPESTLETQEKVPSDRIQRMCPRCQRRHRQGRPLNCEECGAELQRCEDGGDKDAKISGGVEQAAEVAREPGKPLPGRTRSFFENRMGRDFGDVRIHTGTKADRVARSINARAFTLGSDIVFRSGEHRPGTREGKHLLAHELAHVIQHSGGANRVLQRWVQNCSHSGPVPRSVSNPGRVLMNQADNAGRQVIIAAGRLGKKSIELLMTSGEDQLQTDTAQAYMNHFGYPLPRQDGMYEDRVGGDLYDNQIEALAFEMMAVESRLMRIASQLSSTNQNFRCVCARQCQQAGSNTLMWTNPGSSLTRVCPRFWQGGYWQKPDKTVAMLIHEVAHQTIGVAHGQKFQHADCYSDLVAEMVSGVSDVHSILPTKSDCPTANLAPELVGPPLLLDSSR